MTPLADYVIEHTQRGECHCGQCVDVGDGPEPVGHTVNLGFFHVSAVDANKDEFLKLTREHSGEFGDVDPFDGKEHGYMELGGWLGDQGLAMQYMGLGTLLGAFKLRTPAMLGIPESNPMFMQLLGAGLLTIQA